MSKSEDFDEDWFVGVTPVMPPLTQYSRAFERCWKAHNVGVKKAAWQAGVKHNWTDSNWAWLEQYLIRRHSDDVKWLEGKYVPHLSSLINQERFDEENYQRKKPDRWEAANRVDKEITDEEAMEKIRVENPPLYQTIIDSRNAQSH